MLTIKIGGQAGWGIKTFGHWLLNGMQEQSGFGFLYPEYPSLIRGGHNTVTVTLDDQEVPASWRTVDVLVALDDLTLQKDRPDLAKTGRILGWEGMPVKQGWLLPRRWQEEVAAADWKLLFFGALAALWRWPWSVVNVALKQETIARKELAGRGYRWGKEQKTKITLKPGTDVKGIITSGNQAIAQGAIKAGCGYAAIYPMTPVTSILHFLLAEQEKTGMVIFQPEDEIAGINAAIGASYAGRRAMVATSGGGFALMTEAFGMAGMSETPLVVVEGQRTGPATGMPTWTEQGDLQFVVHAAPSEFPRIVLAPGDMAQAGYLAVKAFWLAEKYQLPVVLLADKFLLESWALVPNWKWPTVRYPRLIRKNNNYYRYRLTKSGISPRAIPGQTLVVANSYEHDERGLTSEEAVVRRQQMAKRLGKLKNFHLLEGVGYEGDSLAQNVLVTWGSSRLPILAALPHLPGWKMFYFNQVFPLPEDFRRFMARGSEGVKHRLFLVENNLQGQFGQLLEQEWGVKFAGRLLKNDGRPFFPEEIIEFAKKHE